MGKLTVLMLCELEMAKKRILCFTSWFLPGVKSGGPLRSLTNMFDWLGDQFEFSVVTRDRDLGDSGPYIDRNIGRWYPIKGGQVQYLRATYQTPKVIRSLVQECEPDLLYLNSALDSMLGICPIALRKLGYMRSVPPVVIAPRGEFSPGALAIKHLKKMTYLQSARLLGLYDRVTWHATSIPEQSDIRSQWGRDARIALAANMPPRGVMSEQLIRRPKEPSRIRLVFLSRVSRKKNLLGAIRILEQMSGAITLDIYGSLEDPGYWAECAGALAGLPANVCVAYKGALAPEVVISTLSQYDAFLLPTFGENFGHAILEALLAGCPVILSDQTPWRGLSDRKAGFDLSLNDTQAFRDAIRSLIAMDAAEFALWSESARRCGEEYCAKSDLVAATRDLFEKAINHRPDCG